VAEQIVGRRDVEFGELGGRLRADAREVVETRRR
jgi:hypothetical protein